MLILEYLRWWRAFPALRRVGQPCFHWLAPTTAPGRCRGCWSSAGPPPPPPGPPPVRSSSSSSGKILASALLHPASALSCISTLKIYALLKRSFIGLHCIALVMFYSVIVVLPLNLSFVQLYIVLFVFALIMWPEPSENLKMLLAYHN